MTLHAERLRRLAAAVARSKRAHADIVAARNVEICEAARAHLSVVSIARATGLSRVHVYEIIINEVAPAKGAQEHQEAPSVTQTVGP